MRVSKEDQLVFVSIPKCGSLSGFGFMQENFNAIDPDKTLYHAVKIPSYATGYQIFTFIRNPYDRFVSSWYSNLKFALVNKGAPTMNRRRLYTKLLGSDLILPYAKYVSNLKTYTDMTIVPLHIYLRKFNVKPKLIHIENATEEFNNWFKGKKKYTIPCLRKRPHVSWDEVKTPELINLVNKWAGEDFKLGGYDKE